MASKLRYKPILRSGEAFCIVPTCKGGEKKGKRENNLDIEPKNVSLQKKPVVKKEGIENVRKA